MLLSIALILLVGMSMGWLCRKMKLPGLLGMLSTELFWDRMYWICWIKYSWNIRGTAKDSTDHHIDKSRTWA